VEGMWKEVVVMSSEGIGKPRKHLVRMVGVLILKLGTCCIQAISVSA